VLQCVAACCSVLQYVVTCMQAFVGEYRAHVREYRALCSVV